MAWITPKTDWANNYIPTPTDFNRIEGNTVYLRDEAVLFSGVKTFSDDVIISGTTGDLLTILGTSATSFKMTTSGSGSNNTFIMENTHGATSGRLDMRYKQGEEANFWNVGLDSDGDYKIATNVSGNMSTGVAFAVNKSTGNILINTITDAGGTFKLQSRGDVLIDGSTSAISLKLTNSGSGLNNTIIQENTNGVSSGRIETRYKQAEETNFWNIGLFNDGNYRMTTNASGNMDTGTIFSVNKTTKDFEFTSHVNPTTTPTSGTWTTNITIPRGQYNIALSTVGAGFVSIKNGSTVIKNMSTIKDGGTIYSDGTNVVVNFDNASGEIVTYWKF